MPQRNDETGINVTATKVERNCSIVQGQILNTVIMGNQQPSLDRGRFRDYPYGSRAASDWRFEVASIENDEDIVRALPKGKEVLPVCE